MAKKLIQKSFDNFKGVDRSVSRLSLPPTNARTLQNAVVDKHGSLIQRPGCQVRGHDSYASGSIRTWFGLINYTYLNSDTGATEQELLSWNANSNHYTFWRLQEGTLSLTHPAGGTASEVLFNFYPTAAAQEFVLDITEDGVSLTDYPESYGTGITGSDTLATLVSDLHNHAVDNGAGNYSCVASDSSGAGPLLAGQLPVTIDLDFTNTTETITYYYWEEINSVDIEPEFLPGVDLSFKNPTAAVFNDALYIAFGGDYLLKYDGSDIYRAGVPRHTGPERLTALGSGGSLGGGDYTYVLQWAQKDYRGVTHYGDVILETEPTTTNGTTNTVTVASTGQVQIIIRSPVMGAVVAEIDGAQSTINTIDCTDDYFTAEVGDIVGLWDAVSGLIVKRNVTEVSKLAGSKTVTVDGSAVTVSNADTICLYNEKFHSRGAKVDGNQTSRGGASAAITVETGHTVVVGDTLAIIDRALEDIVERTVTATTSTSITVDGDADMSVDDEDHLSTNHRLLVWRSKVDGVSERYLAKELPLAGEVGFAAKSTFTYTDDIADEELGARLDLPDRAPDPPRKLSYLISHQGIPVGSGSPDDPNTVFWGELDNVEAWPLASNGLDIPFETEGPITGLASLGEALVVFKENERAFVSGDLFEGLFRVDVIKDGIGCSSHHSIAETPVGLIWLSRLGFQRMAQGQVDASFNLKYASELKDQWYEQEDGTAITDSTLLVFKRAQAIADWRNNRYLCYIPAESGTPGTAIYPSDSGRWFCFDYERNIWGEWDYPVDINAYGGLAIYKNELFMMSNYYYIGPAGQTGHLYKEHTRGDKYDSADNYDAIVFKFTTGWDSIGSPSNFKKYLREKTWMLQSDANTAPFSLSVKTYRDFDESTTHSEFTQDFSSATTQEHWNKLKSGKARALQFEFKNNTLHEAPVITGWEYEVVAPHEIEIKDGK